MSDPVTVSERVVNVSSRLQVTQASVPIHDLPSITRIRAEKTVSRTGIGAAHGVIDIVPQQLYYIHVSNFYNLSPTRDRRETISVPTEATKCIFHSITCDL